ncbi:hypothetical protein [Cytobacillus oceanisediminis]|uniref:hypothetical protein n=1 Tax=Cytobacillus oceanisediminis TaxID=665099 RepID=UPI0037353466
MYDQKIMNKLANFKYIIVTSDAQDVPDTLFNRFDNNIIESIHFLEAIAKLPVDQKELIKEWPLTNTGLNHNIIYLNERLLTAELLSSISHYIFGAFFILDRVDLNVIKLIKQYTRLPVISNKHTTMTLVYGRDLISNLYSYWSKSTKEIFKSQSKENQFDDYFKLENRTSIDCYTTLSTNFIKPLYSTINRLRGLNLDLNNGLYKPEPLSPENYEVKEKEADEEIIRALKQLITEKYVTLMVGFFAEGSFDNKDEQILSSFGVNKEEIRDLCEQKDESTYHKIVSKILSKFESIKFNTDMVLCFPSINYHLLMKINAMAGKNKLPKKVLRLFYNSASYYHLLDSKIFDGASDKRKDLNRNTFLYAGSERAKELTVISSLHTMFSLGKQIPFIRTRNVPSQKFYTKTYALARYSEKMEERNKVSDFVRTFKKLSSIITDVVPDEQWEIILNHGNHIKVLSDMPVEWANYRGLPLCVEKKFSRVPITPGNGLISHSYVLKNEYVISRDNLSILIVNTLNKNDQLYQLGVGLKTEVDKYLKLIDRNSIYREASSKDDFVSIIEEIQPSILIFYGHGSYDSIEDIGKLHIGTEYITSVEIENIKHNPLITILGACETQVLHGTHMNTASLFLGNLSVSVLGTFFPVDGLKAFTFISGLIRNLVNTLNGSAPASYFEHWSDIILQTYRAHYVLEPLHSMKSYLIKRGDRLENYIEDPLAEFFQLCEERGIKDFVERLRNRDDIYKEIFSKHKKLEEAYHSILKNNLLLPDSLFYSSLGSPEVIKIKREKANELTKDS